MSESFYGSHIRWWLKNFDRYNDVYHNFGTKSEFLANATSECVLILLP